MSVDPLDEVLAVVPVSEEAKNELRERLSQPDRHYHGTAHVALLWRRHLQYGAGQTVQSQPWHTWLACAIAYHDAIYDATRKDNEARSALLWQQAQPTLSPEGVAWVTGTILATANHLAAAPDPGMSAQDWLAREWMLDLDLTPLGEDQPAFDANTAALRLEFSHLSDADWAKGRSAFLKSISAAPRLFRSAILRTAYESRARENLARDLERARPVERNA